MDHIINNEGYDKVATLQSMSKKIVRNETARLVSKKTNMDSAEENAERMLLFNQTYQERQKQYLVLLSLFVFVFFICLVVVFMQERLGMTSVVVDLLLAVVVSIGGVTAYYLYLNILNRDPLDFSKINELGLLPSPVKVVTEDDTTETVVDANDITAKTLNACVGAACCGPGFVYNNSKCQMR
jgi:hypothetical protein